MRKLVWVTLLAVIAGCPKRTGSFNPRSRFEVPQGGDARARSRFEEARSRFERDDPGAGAEFQAIAREFPKDPIAGHAQLYAGMSAHKNGNHQQAVDILGPLAGDPNVEEGVRARARFHLGVSSAYLGKHREARALLEPFIDKVAPGEEEGELYAALAEATAGLEDREAALGFYDRFFAVARPAEREYIISRVRQIVDALPPDAVRRAWDRADKSRPSAAFLGRRLATMLTDPDEAKEILDDSAQARENVGLSDEARTSSSNADPQLVGALLPMTGKTSRVGELALRGLAVAAGTFHSAAGQGAGAGAPRPFTVMVRDSSSTPEQARAAIDELHQSGVIAVVGPIDKDAAEEAARRAETTAVPLVSLDVAGGGLGTGSPHVFRIVVSVEARARVLANAAMARGLKRFAILVPEHSYGSRGARAFREEVERQGGTIVVEQKYAKDATSFVDEVKKVAGKPWDALFIPDTAAKLGLIAPQLAVANLVVQPAGATKTTKVGRGIVLLSTAEAMVPKFVKDAGRYVQGAVLAPGFYPDDADPRIAPFVHRFRTAYSEDPDYLAAYAWDAALVIRAAIEAGARDRASLRQAMGTAKVVGVTGEIQFDASRQRADGGVLFTVQGQAVKVWK